MAKTRLDAPAPVIELRDHNEDQILAVVPLVPLQRTPLISHQGMTFVASKQAPNGHWIYRRQLV